MMQKSYLKWQGQLNNIPQQQVSYYTQAIKPLSSYAMAIVAAYISVVLMHSPVNADPAAQKDYAMQSQSFTDDC